MHNYFTNYHTPTCFDTIVPSSGISQLITLPSYTSMSNAVVGNTIQNYFTQVYAVEISNFKIFKILKLSHF
jgi:hypothetical protein